MIIHNPKISGSLQFPSDENGNLITFQVQNGTLETKTLNSSGVDQGIQPAVNYSGSFTGSFVGDGSSLTGVAASGFNIDILDALTVVPIDQSDTFLISDGGTEKKITFSNVEDSVFSNVSGDISIAAGGAVTIGNEFKNDSLNSATGSYLTSVDISTNTNLAVSDTSEVNMILSGDTLSAELIGGVISGSAQVSIDASQISDVDAFSQSGNYSGLRAQATTAGDVGLGNVDNTSDANKPVSTAGQTALDLKANLASPALTGNPTAPTQADNDNSTKIATTAYVQREVSDLLGGAPAAFDTLLEISASIANGDSDVVALTTTVGTKLAKASNLSDLSNAGTARTNLGVDAAGTDNSTDVTLAGRDYLTVSGQEITAGTINNDDLANSSITIDGSAISLGGSVTTLQLGSTSSTALAGDTTTISGGQASAITANTAKVGYTDALVKSKLDTEAVFSGSITSADISDVAAFSQSGTYSGLRAQATTAGDVGLGNVTNESKATMFTSAALTSNPTAPTQTGTDDSTKIATTAFVQDRIDTIIGNAGSTLDTLGELSASLSDDEDALTSLTTTVGTKLAKASNLSDLANASTARTNLGVAIGSDVQAFNSTLATVAGGTYAGDNSIVTIGTVTTGDVQTILPSGVVSGSAQVQALGGVNNNTITFSAGAGLDGGGAITLNQGSDETVTFTVGDGVVSGSDQVASTFAQTILDDTSAGAVRTTIGVDAAGTDNSTDVTLAGNDYLTISGQEITAGAINNDDLTNSSITIDGSAISLGGSITTNNTQLSTEAVQDIVGGMVSGNTESGITVTYDDTGNSLDFSVASQTDENFTTADHSKLDGIEAGAEVNVVTSVASKTGDVSLVKGDVGLGNVDNTADSAKPVSTAQQTALDLKANLASPTFTGTPISTTPSANDDSTKIATTAYVQAELTALIGTAPATLDTLGEISASIANGDSDVVALTTTVGTKLAKASNLSDLANASTARTNLGVDAAGTDNSTDVTLAGSLDYLTISGQEITRNSIVLTTDVSGVLPSANMDADTAHLSGTQTFSGAKSFSLAVNIDATTASTSKTTGALIVDGGVGIAGALNVGGDVVAYASSDERLKDNIELISNPIEKVQALKGVTWDWNSNADELQQSLPNVGVIAQDVEKVLPQLVTDRDNGFKGVDYAKLTGLLIEAVKDQQKQIDELKNKLS